MIFRRNGIEYRRWYPVSDGYDRTPLTRDEVIEELRQGACAVVQLADSQVRVKLPDEPIEGAINEVLRRLDEHGSSGAKNHRPTDKWDQERCNECSGFHHAYEPREGEKCRTAGCSGIVKRFTQNGRSTFWCPKCQK